MEQLFFVMLLWSILKQDVFLANVCHRKPQRFMDFASNTWCCHIDYSNITKAVHCSHNSIITFFISIAIWMGKNSYLMFSVLFSYKTKHCKSTITNVRYGLLYSVTPVYVRQRNVEQRVYNVLSNEDLPSSGLKSLTARGWNWSAFIIQITEVIDYCSPS